MEKNNQDIKIASDVTVQHDLLHDSKAIFEALDRSLAVIEFEPTGVVISANRNFLDTMGYRLDEIKGHQHRMFCDELFYQNIPISGRSWLRGRSNQGAFSDLIKKAMKSGWRQPTTLCRAAMAK